MKSLLVCLVAVFPIAAAAQTLPALHDVVGVSSNDTLNVRAEPDAGSAIVGTLAPDQTNVEIVAHSPNGKWAMLNAGETAGWAALRFLKRQPDQDWQNLGEFGVAPRALRCFGTEPFWGLTLSDGDEYEYASLSAGPIPQTGTYVPVRSASNRSKRGFLGYPLDNENVGFVAGNDTLTGIITHEICSDGMSDQLYGLSIDMLHETAMSRNISTGCCSLVGK